MQTIEHVAALRRQLWQAGFRPVPVLNPIVGDKSTGKTPLGRQWQIEALRDPPACIAAAVEHALNTGILCNGLRAVDFDIDDADLVTQCYQIAADTLPAGGLLRRRAGSPRCMLIFRAADGEPPNAKPLVGRAHDSNGRSCKIEALGRGHHFVAYGPHWTGAEHEWPAGGPDTVRRDDLPTVTEDQIRAFFIACAPVLDAPPPSYTNGHDQDHQPGEAQADAARVATALFAIPNSGPPDWECWNKAAMAVWRATGGAAAGWHALAAWSALNPAYDPAATRARWEHYTTSPPTSIGAGSIFRAARRARAGLLDPFGPDDDQRKRPDWQPHGDPRDDVPPVGEPIEPAPATDRRILTGAEFMTRHVPPVWLIDGIVQRSRLYSCTSLTGHGKTAVWLFNACMIHAGRAVGHLPTFQGNVLIMAGENPADLEARMIGMAKAYGIPSERMPFVLPGSFPLTNEAADVLRQQIIRLGVPLALIIGDTASSFFSGEDENDNKQAGDYARTWRGLIADCAGNPAVMVLCHPIKNASRTNLLPRGGGALLNEMDANLTHWLERPGEVTELHWQGKIRGPDFVPLSYRLRQVPTGLVDERGRPEITVIAEPLSEEAAANQARQALANEDAVLIMVRDHPDWSQADMARHIGWVDDAGRAEKWLVARALEKLRAGKLVKQLRNGKHHITDAGESALRGEI